MKLVSSNDEETVKETIQKAMDAYWKDTNASAALTNISKLRGIGPATASLLLSVHDPDHVIFFSDEAFWWLSCGGKKAPIKYNAKEYEELNKSAQEVVKRLNVSATEVEKVAYVVMKDGDLSTIGSGGNQGTPSSAESASQDSKKAGVKRKEQSESSDPSGSSLRRSKRGKNS
jgi:hypothetical protein